MLGLLLVLAGTTEPLAQLDLREERAVLLAADSAFAVHASRAQLPAFRDVLDEDVIFLDPGERMLFGKAATLAMLGSDGMSAAATQDWRAVRVDVSADGGAGYTYGFGSMTGPLGPGPLKLKVQEVAIGAADAAAGRAVRPTQAVSSAQPQ